MEVSLTVYQHDHVLKLQCSAHVNQETADLCCNTLWGHIYVICSHLHVNLLFPGHTQGMPYVNV